MSQRKGLFIFLFFFFIFFSSSKIVFSGLKINEIYPAPPSGREEWVELYNDEENNTIDLSLYSLFDANNKKIIFSTDSAQPLSYILATSSSVLNNSGPEIIYLKDINNNILDVANYSSSFDANKSLIRCPDANGEWYISTIITKGFSNGEACAIFNPTLTLTPTSTITEISSPTSTLTSLPSPTSTPTLIFSPTSYENIYLSEVMVNPGNGEKEWVEIYNDNDFLVELKNWFIDDLENAGSTAKNFNIVIDKKSYGVIELSAAIFNNNGDEVRLLDFNKREKDSFEYLSSQIGKSYGRISFASDEWCQQEPSRGEKNSVCLINPTKVNFSSTASFISQAINSPSTLSPKNKDNLSLTKKIYKSFQPKLQVYTPEKNLVLGEVLGEKTENSNKNDDILFLPIFQSLLMSFLFLRKILKSIKIEN